MSELVSLFTNLLVNLVGVFVGVYLALWVDRRERRKVEEKDKLRIAKSLQGELKANLERLQSKDEITIYKNRGKERKTLLTRFNTAILESAINSGQMTLLEPYIQDNLSNIHQILSLCEMTTDRVLSFITSIDRALTKKKQILDWLLDNLATQYRTLAELIPETVEALRSDTSHIGATVKTSEST